MQKINRILIANRGEIAVRILRTVQAAGLDGIVIYSDSDAGTLPVRLAEQKIALHGNRAQETYLDIEKITTAIVQSGADAVHPGYGFLAENAEFATAVNKHAKFIGPSVDVIRKLGDKDLARKAAVIAGVPVVPGIEDVPKEAMSDAAKRVGYPLMIKAVAGGSGRGMRIVREESQLSELYGQARREAMSAFGRDEVIFERYIERARHIEVQIVADEHGSVIALGERECSLQRRHQKLVEECPAPKIHPTVRNKLHRYAVSLSKSVGYSSLGTVEFLVGGGESKDSEIYFLEMNTRIQVEHPVTEAVFGVDLVELQLKIAGGVKLKTILTHPPEPKGHAIQFRVNAEDVTAEFKPASGEIKHLSRIGGPGVREDGWIESGSVVSPYYDNLLSKLIIWGEDRNQAISRARVALGEYLVEGLHTTLPFHRWIVGERDFIEGNVDTDWVKRNYHGQVGIAKSVGPLELPVSSEPYSSKQT